MMFNRRNTGYPSPRAKRERNRLIYSAFLRGDAITKLAYRHKLTRATVYELIANAKQGRGI